MILLTLILVCSVLFLTRLFNLKFTKNMFLQLKNHFFTSPEITHKPKTADKPSAASTNKNNAGLKQVFDTFDKNSDGFITRQELKESLNNIGIVLPAKEVEEIVENLDSNRDGLIDMSEFEKLFEMVWVKREENIDEEGNEVDNEEDLRQAFEVFDGDKDGRISVEELRKVLSSLGLKEGKRVEDCKEMIKKVDVDGDGMVDFDEFKKMMMTTSCFQISR